MSREKQVEEMEFTEVDILANDINQHCADLAENYCGDTHCVACLANALYNTGYRKQEWISVEDRLPKHQEKVLVCDTQQKMVTALYLTYDNGGFDWCTSVRLTNKVTHWMPSPEAPKMKGGE